MDRDPEAIAALAVLGIVGTGFAYVLNYQIITSDGATAASMVTYLLPVVAIVLGALVRNEDVRNPADAGSSQTAPKPERRILGLRVDRCRTCTVDHWP